jgi:hypothetical protein
MGAIFWKVVGGMIRSPGNGGQQSIIVAAAVCCVASFGLAGVDVGSLGQLFPPIAVVLGDYHNNVNN